MPSRCTSRTSGAGIRTPATYAGLAAAYRELGRDDLAESTLEQVRRQGTAPRAAAPDHDDEPSAHPASGAQATRRSGPARSEPTSRRRSERPAPARPYCGPTPSRAERTASLRSRLGGGPAWCCCSPVGQPICDLRGVGCSRRRRAVARSAHHSDRHHRPVVPVCRLRTGGQRRCVPGRRRGVRPVAAVGCAVPRRAGGPGRTPYYLDGWAAHRPADHFRRDRRRCRRGGDPSMPSPWPRHRSVATIVPTAAPTSAIPVVLAGPSEATRMQIKDVGSDGLSLRRSPGGQRIKVGTGRSCLTWARPRSRAARPGGACVTRRNEGRGRRHYPHPTLPALRQRAPAQPRAVRRRPRRSRRAGWA